MKAGVFYKPGDIRVKEVPNPKIKKPHEAVVKVTYSCICGSDLWSYRGLRPRDPDTRVGHEFMGIVEKTGKGVKKIKKGDMVVAPFLPSDGTCPECKAGLSSYCRNTNFWGSNGYDGGQGEKVLVPYADTSLFKFPKNTPEKLMPGILTTADVFCTGHHAAVCAGVMKGSTVAIIGDGAVGLCAVLASKRLGAKKIILLSHHEDRAKIGKKFGATDIVKEKGKANKKVKELTGDLGADCVLECVGTKEAWETAFDIVRKGGRIGFVGIPTGVKDFSADDDLFRTNTGIMGGLAPAASYIPLLLPDVLSGKIDPSPVFTKTISLEELPVGYKAMDEREDIKVLIKF